MVDGVVLSMESTIASLRAACKRVGMSQSGSRGKLFKRLVSHFEQKQLEVIYAAHPVIPVVQPRPQMLATPPADFATFSLHELTHLPYEPWCAVCVSNKGRPEAHISNPMRQTEPIRQCGKFRPFFHWEGSCRWRLSEIGGSSGRLGRETSCFECF